MTGAPNDLPTETRTQSAGAQRMALHRSRRRHGLKCITIELRETEIDLLVRQGRLSRDRRADRIAVRNALHALLEDVFG
jgi:hypothetical protein